MSNDTLNDVLDDSLIEQIWWWSFHLIFTSIQTNIMRSRHDLLQASDNDWCTDAAFIHLRGIHELITNGCPSVLRAAAAAHRVELAT